ncbi:TetR/AcrR family transcriptional regulator [Desertihabitans brevis]|uniref:TetR/AcrR family transcriptional regulator n=1 Tax=Desertihabitans brevis TaxID=2268447 RepID=A0A367YV22_9ACTN|nr:TetR/AcrR family transcriptional regulator [Desertihabitans brevis]RCK69736.1 TetR/AcrR family transcriptional regulator [Desertihabitans brevis]
MSSRTRGPAATGADVGGATGAGRRRGPYAKSAGRRRQILDVALARFASRGYRAASLREIAADAGISLSTLMHHFPTKEDLLLATLGHRDEAGAVETPTSAANFPTAVLARARRNEDLRGLIEVYTVLCAEATTAGHPGSDYFVRRFTHLRQEYAGYFAELARQGRLRPGVDPERAATSLVALWDGLQLQWLHAPAQVDVARHLEDFLALVLRPAASPPDAPA